MTLVPRLESPDAFADLDALASVLGPIRTLTREPLRTNGYSGSSHERIHVELASGAHRALVLKRTRLANDFTAFRTRDTVGREALPLEAPEFADVWRVFACPYLAFARAPGEVALLMDDIGAHLLPDERAPLAAEAEDRLIGAIAALHARFWNAPVLDHPGLAPTASVAGLLEPGLSERVDAGPAHPVLTRAGTAWRTARTLLPPALVERLWEPIDVQIGRWAELPRTLLHGDVKVANFALLPDGRVAAFDWSCVTAGPAAMDLGWYLAVNATRLAGSKEATLALYRRKLEAELGTPIAGPTWRAMEAATVRAGALTLLWSKALALANGGDAARAEWAWWVDRLELD